MARWRIGTICLATVVLASLLSQSGAQNCGNTGGNCNSRYTTVSQCTSDGVEECCSRCAELAGCFDLSTNCYNQYTPNQCYFSSVSDNCCLFCRSNQKDFLGEACRYGDLQTGCTANRCGESDEYDGICCETCFDGAPVTDPPTVPTAQSTATPQLTTRPVVTAAATTTSDPNVCTDDLSTCASLVNSVPSSCYSGDLRSRCCASCENMISRRQSLGFNVVQCPYGDRSSTCVTDDFNVESCADEDIAFVCCDACGNVEPPTTPPTTTTIITTTPYEYTGGNNSTTADPGCVDSVTISCDLPDRYCYASESTFYNNFCCATCRQAVRTNLPVTCLYGDRDLGCPIIVGADTDRCNADQEARCCETCYALTVTQAPTTVDPCQDTSELCPALIGNQARNCYEIGDLCCASCRSYVQDARPDSCRFGDKIALCSADLCDTVLADSCCATCADVTTPVPTTTEEPCIDTDNNCVGGLLQLPQNPERCYNDEVRSSCCSTCRLLANSQSETCAWGDRDGVCGLLQNLNCNDPSVAEICCGRCGDVRPRTTTPEPTTPDTPPPNCVDTLTNCDTLTRNLYNCYADNSALVASGCCATCWSQRKIELPLTCYFGDRVGFCNDFIASDPDFCEDTSVRRDCCESCFRAADTTPVPTTTPELCPNEWSDLTCERLVEQLGDCSTIEEKCCRTCTVTQAPTTPTTTTMATTTEEVCPDTLPTNVCVLIITAEGQGECYTDYMQEQCCGSCSYFVTTSTMAPTTTTPTCPEEDSLPCLDIQIITEESNICDEGSAFVDSCCNFCLSGGTVSTDATTDAMSTVTAFPPDCDGNIWSLVVCAATVSTSPEDNPCEDSQVIADNCCAYCAMTMSTRAMSTTPRVVTTPPVVCAGDDPSLDCSALSGIINDICGDDSEFTNLCCGFCAPNPTTTMLTTPGPVSTTTGTGFCSTNPLGAVQCEALFSSQGGLPYCASNFMLDNCCLFCSQVTAPPTTPPPVTTTTFQCVGDNQDLNCTSLDATFSERLCDPSQVVTAELRKQCCDYCANKPITTTVTTPTTTTVTTAVCIDMFAESACEAIANTGSCETDTGTTECCATCREFLATTVTTQSGATTTTQLGTTTECIDSQDINCTSLAELIDPCVGETRSLCCDFCSTRTTPASTTPPPTLAPCFGNTFQTAVCEERNRTDSTFCDSDSVWIKLCCEFCGQEVVTTASQGTNAPTTAAPSTAAPSTVDPGQTTTEAVVCNGNLFTLSLCQQRIDSVPSSCDDEDWYSVCCDFCDNLASAARKRRSVDDVGALRRTRRQASCVNQWSENQCEAAVYSSSTVPKYGICIEDYMRGNCCGYCAAVSTPGVLPTDCSADKWEYNLCQLVVGNEGLSQCLEPEVADNCCIYCALASIRTAETTTTPLTSTTMPPTTTDPITTPLPECEQRWTNATCLSLLENLPCSSNVIRSTCCDFHCAPTVPSTTTTVSVPTTVERSTVTSTTTTQTTEPTTTTRTTSPEPTTPAGPVTDPIPVCGVADNAQTCPSYILTTPSGCYQPSVFNECCQSCTDYYYERKAAGYNADFCSYGNRISSCPTNVDCDIPEVARDCCDVCYPRESVTVRPVVSAIMTEYIVTLSVVSPCSQLYNNPNSFVFLEFSKFVRSGMQSIFSILPGEQIYTVNSISCDPEDGEDRLKVHVGLTTSPTHTYSELQNMFDMAVQDGRLGVLDIVSSNSVFEHEELFDAFCEVDTITNCDQYALSPNSDCYHPDPYSRCCASCNAMGAALYTDRAYIPVGCEFGDKADECSPDVDCNTPEAKRECCYTCAPEPADYTTPLPSTTTTTMPETTTTEEMSTSSTTTSPTTPTIPTTQEPCLGDTSDRCDSLTADPMSCYNMQLVYSVCCRSCQSMSRWDLPSNCAWGNQEVWCDGITEDQCTDPAIFATCCDRCGPHLTSTTESTSTTMTAVPTTTAVCDNTRSNCPDLTEEAIACYDWSEDCCASCRPKILDYLPEDCQFGDKSATCLAYSTDDCVDPAKAAECCQLCGPEAPTTMETTSMSSSSTTESPTTVTTTDPGCVADISEVCSLLTTNGGCYEADKEEQCCLTCEGKLDTDAPLSCRYGDHEEYCSDVTRERCLTEVRVFEDCCKTCEGLVAPPGVCIDTVPNCQTLISYPAACYTDLIYSQCCYSCEQIVRGDLDTTCQWGNLATFCESYTRDDCDTVDGLADNCCALCTAPLTTTTTEAAPTSTQPQCVDEPTADCTQDTSERRYCYDQGIENDCCASCRLHQDSARRSCPYGDREAWCQYFVNQEDQCDEPLIRETCCQLCAPPPTTTMPTTSACYDTSVCNSHISNCYKDEYKDRCCSTCQTAYDADALFRCEYGDRADYCHLVTPDQCLQISAVRDECCETCPILTQDTTLSPVTTTTTSTSTTTPAPTPSTDSPSTAAQCVDTGDTCSTITPDDCYESAVRDNCCETCAGYDSGEAECLYGDKDVDFCRADMDCSLSVVRELCCNTCARYIIPNVVLETYRLKVNVTSHRCTAGLNDRGSSTYLVFKYQIELAVTQILDEIPGVQLAQLVDISCGSVVAILEIQSRGFYSVDAFNRMFMLELADGQLGQLGVSTVGSSLSAISFEPPTCINGDFSLNCLTNFVLSEPSLCFEANVRSQCCRSCSSLFYARLANGVDITTCPYGDRDAECFSLSETDCANAEARDRCCDRCASFTTPTAPSTVPTTTVITTAPCFDDDANLCAQGVQNSLSFCYMNEGICCNTCRARRIEGLPDTCAWGDQRDYCADRVRADCDTDAEVNSTCCALCGDYTVDPTAQPCLGDVNNFQCTITIQSNPSRCYDSDFYSGCCESCNNARMEWLPTGCLWGDKADFCDSTTLICNAFGDNVCCGSCCTDCEAPSTVITTTPTTPVPTTSTTTTQATTTRKDLPAGCNGDVITTCATVVANPQNCYPSNNLVEDLCCESCYDVRRQDLPLTCPYGDRINTCGGITWPQCNDRNSDVGSDCCETCFGLLEICDEESQADVTNCMASVTRPGGCYSPDVLQNCCSECKAVVNYNLPIECRFGNRVSWCGDITDENIDRICKNEDYQLQCCDTCRDYIGLSTSTIQPVTLTSTTTIGTSTRLPPNEQCPDGDTDSDCETLTSGTGACYDPDVSAVCCRTCYEEWRGDLPRDCRYGDKSKYCTTVDDDDVDRDWCISNGDTCCARCASYLTTTVPTTTLPAECPNGNTLDSCSIRVQSSSDCYSPPREEGCCVECTGLVRPELPYFCRYGDKADYCQDISESECPDHAETCCEKCAAYLTTTTPVPSTTALPIVRPSVLIGTGLFNRPVPPGDSMLYQITYFTGMEGECIQLDTESNDFNVDEAKICTDMGSKFWSLTNCYVAERTCNNAGNEPTVNYRVMILIDRTLNYVSVSDVNSQALEAELLASQSKRKRRSILYFDLLIRDVNECDPSMNALLRDGCDNQASCTNTDGLYTCACPEQLIGNGFSCTAKLDPLIGRSAFSRGVPPGYHYLYKLVLNLRSTGAKQHGCFADINKIDSTAFGNEEFLICTALSDAFNSLHSCYIEDFNCDNDYIVEAYIVIDAELNYLDKRVTQTLLKNELSNYNGEIVSNVIDVNECTVEEPLITNHCTADSECVNSAGLYDCVCTNGNKGFVGVSTCLGNAAPTLPTGERSVSSGLADWTIAVIIISAVILLVAISLAIGFGCRKARNDDAGHRPLNSGEETPPRLGGSLPPLYNSLRSTHAPRSEIGSYFYAQQEKELPGYAMKTYNDTYRQSQTQGHDNDTAVFTFE